MTQNDLAITAGVAHSTLHRIEAEKAPDGGGKTGIDIVMRLAAALKMSPLELMVMPTGNRFERAVSFAAQNHSAEAAPKLHDTRRTVRADGYRAITGASMSKDMFPPIREETDAAALDEDPAPDAPTPAWSQFHPDPSSE